MLPRRSRSNREWGWETGPSSQKGENMAETQARKDWTKENTTFVGLKLNKRTDADILAAIDGKAKQTELKRLIRQGMKLEQPKQ